MAEHQQWTVQLDRGKTYGPMSTASLKTLATSGRLRPEHLIQKLGSTKWVPASLVKGLFPDQTSTLTPTKGGASAPTTPPAPTVHLPGEPSKPGPPPTIVTPSKVIEGSPEKKRPVAQDQRIASWVFGSILLAFFLGVFLFAPSELPEFKQRILAVSSALLSGLFGFFFTGQIRLELKFVKQRFGDLGVKSTGGAALFVLMLCWWLSPFAPVKAGLDLEPIQYFAANNQISVMTSDVAGILYSFDRKTWKPAQGFTATKMGFKGVTHATARLDPKDRAAHNNVFIKYTSRNGSESLAKEIAYDPEASIYSESGRKNMEEAQGTPNRAMAEAKTKLQGIKSFTSDYNRSHEKIEHRKLSRVDFAQLGKLPILMSLELIGCEFDEADLEALQPAGHLNSLILSDSLVSDEGMRHLVKLQSLRDLNLSGTRVTDDGVALLGELSDLHNLNLDRTKVTGSGFASFPKFLNRLSLRSSAVDDAGAKYLGTTKKTKSGNEHQKATAVASEFDLGDTGLTDAGLICFEGANQLSKMKLDGTKVTADGISSLKKRRPSLRIEW